MADPLVVACAENAWTKVATNVIIGMLWRMTTSAKYQQTFRLTGTAAPTDLLDSVPIFRNEESDYEKIEAPAGIDVYIYCTGDAGKVRVDV